MAPPTCSKNRARRKLHSTIFARSGPGHSEETGAVRSTVGQARRASKERTVSTWLAPASGWRDRVPHEQMRIASMGAQQSGPAEIRRRKLGPDHESGSVGGIVSPHDDRG